jgi:hypothetical protein
MGLAAAEGMEGGDGGSGGGQSRAAGRKEKPIQTRGYMQTFGSR